MKHSDYIIKIDFHEINISNLSLMDNRCLEMLNHKAPISKSNFCE
jgi:hypothetical protein